MGSPPGPVEGIFRGLPPEPSGGDCIRGLPPRARLARASPRHGWRAAPPFAYVTPSRLALLTASLNSPSACACHLDVATRRRFTPARHVEGKSTCASGGVR